MVRAEKTIAERDRDSYFEASTTNFEQFRRVEAELVAEQEKVRTLEAELARVRREAVEDFKKSKEFDDILAAEFDSSFAETFKSCWERIIDELGSQIEGVTLERFPVPKLPGEETPSPMAVEDLGGSHPLESQDLEIPTEDLMIQDSHQDEKDLGKGGEALVDEAREKAAQGEETQEVEARLHGSTQEQEDVFDDGLP